MTVLPGSLRTVLGPMRCRECGRLVVVSKAGHPHRCVRSVGRVRGERCACRGYIEVADETDECEIRDTVQAHNRTDEHQQYVAFGHDQGRISARDTRRCPGIDEVGCGRTIRPADAMCYPCARRAALGLRVVA